MTSPDGLHYLSVVDPGFASLVWPTYSLKQFSYQRGYLDKIRRVFCFHLLWQRSLVLRHIDVFNNVPLMRFLQTDEASALTLGGCLHLAVREDAPLSELFEQCARGGDPPHWHHFSPGRQLLHDERFRSAKKRDFAWLSEELELDAFGIELKALLSRCDKLFRASRHVLKHAPTDFDFSSRVLQHWNDLMLNTRQVGTHDRRHVDAVSELLVRGAKEQWRRRRFFTELGTLGNRIEIAPGFCDAVVTAKLGAVNQAFYDEFETFRYEKDQQKGPIAVSRNLTHLARQTPAATLQNSIDLYGGERLCPLDTLPLQLVARWHDEEATPGANYTAFRASIASLAAAQSRPPGTVSQREVDQLISHHVKVINQCVAQAVKDDGLKLGRHASLVQAYAPQNPEWAQVGFTVGASLLSGICTLAADLQHVRALIVTSAFTIISTLASAPVSPARPWQEVTASLKQQIEERFGPPD